MGFTIVPKITVATAEGPVTIKTDDITAIAIAPDLGANITFVEDGDTKMVLTVESFLRVISYFNS